MHAVSIGLGRSPLDRRMSGSFRGPADRGRRAGGAIGASPDGSKHRATSVQRTRASSLKVRERSRCLNERRLTARRPRTRFRQTIVYPFWKAKFTLCSASAGMADDRDSAPLCRLSNRLSAAAVTPLSEGAKTKVRMPVVILRTDLEPSKERQPSIQSTMLRREPIPGTASSALP
jgi:hypothetical protein